MGGKARKPARELTYVPAASQAHIDGFIDMLWLEKGCQITHSKVIELT